jgi:hypothetical protein
MLNMVYLEYKYFKFIAFDRSFHCKLFSKNKWKTELKNLKTKSV